MSPMPGPGAPAGDGTVVTVSSYVTRCSHDGGNALYNYITSEIIGNFGNASASNFIHCAIFSKAVCASKQSSQMMTVTSANC